MSTSVDYEYRSDLFRKIAADAEATGEEHGQAIGMALGEADAIVTVLEGRGVPVSDGVRDHIRACTDLATLKAWLLRALTAATAEDVIA